MTVARPSRKVAGILAMVALAAFPVTLGVAWLRVLVDGNTPSKVFGTVAHGRIEHAHVIPPWGPGFMTYSFLGSAVGRQYVDGRVRDALVAAFAARSRAEGGRTFVVGETGWPSGGTFRPHRSHQNGMAVDIFMPVESGNGEPTRLGTWPWNMFGYGLEFNERGELGDLRIQFESVAAFLLEVDAQARQLGLRVARIIITPDFCRSCSTRRPVVAWVRSRTSSRGSRSGCGTTSTSTSTSRRRGSPF
jgi:penicillin-insensitive murein endopeptidase